MSHRGKSIHLFIYRLGIRKCGECNYGKNAYENPHETYYFVHCMQAVPKFYHGIFLFFMGCAFSAGIPGKDIFCIVPAFAGGRLGTIFRIGRAYVSFLVPVVILTGAAFSGIPIRL